MDAALGTHIETMEAGAWRFIHPMTTKALLKLNVEKEERRRKRKERERRARWGGGEDGKFVKVKGTEVEVVRGQRVGEVTNWLKGKRARGGQHFREGMERETEVMVMAEDDLMLVLEHPDFEEPEEAAVRIELSGPAANANPLNRVIST